MTTPELTDLGDARVLNELSGSIPLTDTLRATVSLEWRRDSRPPEGVKSRFVCKSGGSSSPSARLLGRPPVSGGVRGRGNAGRPRRVWS